MNNLTSFFDCLINNQSDFIPSHVKENIATSIHPTYKETYSWMFEKPEGMQTLEDETLEIMAKNEKMV